MTPQELKNSILQLAIQGKLVEQRAEDGTAEELFVQIQEEKQRLIAEKKIKKEKPLPEITEEEKPFDIPKSWKWCRINQISYLNSGGQYQENETGIPYIKVADMNLAENIIEIQTSSRFVKCSEADLVYPSSIIFPKRGGAIATNKKRKVLKMPICIDSNTMAMSLFFKEIFDYVYVWFISIDLERLSTGTSVPQINNKDIEPLLIPLPPLAEQKRIVAKIEELLPYIDRYEQAWSKLEKFNSRFPEDMKKSLLQYAIQGKLVEQRAEEGTAEELFAKIQEEKQRLIAEKKIKKEKPLPEITEDEKPFDIPESWKWVSVGSVCTNIQYGSSQKSAASGKVAVLRMGNIQDGKLILDKLVYTSDEAEIQKYPLRYNDLLFNRTNSKELVGKTAIYKGEIPAIYAGYLVRITPLYMNSDYLNYVMQSQFYWSYCQSVRSDAIGQSNINAEKLKRFVFPLPPLAEQKRIVEKLEQLLPLCERLK